MTLAVEQIRVVLVDDQPLIRRGFLAILETEPGITVVGEAGDGREALEVIDRTAPDVVCMDVQMPVMDGIDATRALKAAGSTVPVLILTTFGHDEFLFRALEAGASGFLLKTAEAEGIIAAIKTLAKGESLLAPEVTGRVLNRFLSTPGAPTAEPPPELERLTAREREVLLLLAEGRSNAEIAAELFIGQATVKTHVSNAMMKIGAKDRVQAVIWVFRNHLAG